MELIEGIATTAANLVVLEAASLLLPLALS
ncbi:MAG: hypothetical protein RI985_217 [Chloroflexota bacterium]|jgi:hypothetical protein